ncbi:hypothetical protein ACFL3N_01645 [Candidatus Omnitrophota bacterium]
MPKRITTLSFFLIFTALFLCQPALALKLNIDPPRVEINVKPGEETSGYVNVLNYDEKGMIHVKAYAQDLVYLPDGSNDFLPLESTPWSMSDFIKIGPTEFDIPAGSNEMVRYIVSVPEEAKGGFYGVVFFEVATPPSEFTGAGANVNVRLGSIFLLTVEGTEAVEAKLKAIDIAGPGEETPLDISVTVYNGSNILVRPFGSVKIIGMDKTIVAEIPMNKKKGGIFPRTNGKFSSQYEKKLKAGDYFAQVVLDYGGEVLLGGQKKFTID